MLDKTSSQGRDWKRGRVGPEMRRSLIRTWEGATGLLQRAAVPQQRVVQLPVAAPLHQQPRVDAKAGPGPQEKQHLPHSAGGGSGAQLRLLSPPSQPLALHAE